ncbi:hypothetical protein K438DRAFT_1872261 [Mycena galopus ATCC 62051]|nr:hypothetical protein K438DRAFT_1872261 [Mycena galopus ATCC 62051]
MLPHLAADRALVADLDAKISDLERSLFALRTQKQLAQERLDSYKYPVLTIPNELTTEIFIHFLPIYPRCPALTGLESPTLLTQICRQWRGTALETPALWRAISLFSIEGKTHLLDTWLSRSRHCPLSIQFDKDDDEEPQAIELLSALVPHQGSMPLLRHLDLAILDGLDAITTFSPAPLLRSITLRANTPLKLAFPLGQLTSLTLNLIYRSEYVAILQQTSNLVHCELVVIFDWLGTSDLPPDRAIELPRLESLALMTDEAPASAGFLESFLGAAPIDELASFISKSGCKLRRVCITSIEGLVGFTASYREAFPSIHRFSFDHDADAASISTNSTDQ